ncbi:MAG: hypothetical protein KC535_05630, partial [Nanoarchaeota archaeon]|nr:hypothetical protein [Nanoarchaeota archaeon]
MFVRAKTVKGKKYAYLVENSWKKGKVKQLVKRYLGRIIELDTPEKEGSQVIDFSLPQKKVMQQIIANEFLLRGFVQARGEVYVKGNVSVNLTKGLFSQEGKEVVFLLNDRYLYGRLVRDLLDFFAPESEEERKGQKLAQALSDAGISVAQEDFI